MPDRTFVKLSIPKQLLDKAKSLIPDIEGNTAEEWCCPPHEEQGIKMITFGYEEVSFGDLEFEHILEAHKIPYDKEWESGDNYDAGEKVYRIDADGETVIKEFQTATFDMIPYPAVKVAAEQGLDKVNALLDNYNDKFSVIPWMKQMEILSSLNV